MKRVTKHKAKTWKGKLISFKNKLENKLFA